MTSQPNRPWTETERQLIDRLLAGESTVEEREQAEAIFGHSDIPGAIRTALSDGVAPIGDDDLAASWAILRGEIDGVSVAESAGRANVEVRPSRKNVGVAERGMGGWLRGGGLVGRTMHQSHAGMARLAYGAALAGVLTFGFVAHQIWPIRSSERTVARDYSTMRGQRATVTLADGSRAQLEPETTLRFTTVDKTGDRAVELTGQAHFSVSPDDSRPFIVRAAGATVRVLGTEFIVRKYQTDRVVQIVVASGKVSVQPAAAGSRGTIASAGTMIQVSDSGSLVAIPVAELGDKLAWTRGQLVFRDAPVTTVVPELERRYNIEIRFADSSLAHEKLTATIDAETSTQVLDLLGVALNARYTRKGNIVTFTPTRRVLRSNPSRSFPLTSEQMYGR